MGSSESINNTVSILDVYRSSPIPLPENLKITLNSYKKPMLSFQNNYNQSYYLPTPSPNTFDLRSDCVNKILKADITSGLVCSIGNNMKAGIKSDKGIGSSGNYLNKKKLIFDSVKANIVTENTKSKSNCAVAVREALAAAGIRLIYPKDHSRWAKDYGCLLLCAGFVQVVNYKNTFENGDIMVFQGWKNCKWGHIQIYFDKIWYSDYNQGETLKPNKLAREGELYRYLP